VPRLSNGTSLFNKHGSSSQIRNCISIYSMASVGFSKYIDFVLPSSHDPAHPQIAAGAFHAHISPCFIVTPNFFRKRIYFPLRGPQRILFKRIITLQEVSRSFLILEVLPLACSRPRSTRISFKASRDRFDERVMKEPLLRMLLHLMNKGFNTNAINGFHVNLGTLT